MACCVFGSGITVAVAVEGSVTTLMLGEEGLLVVPTVAKNEGSILQKMSRKQKLTADNCREDETIAKKIAENDEGVAKSTLQNGVETVIKNQQ
jgi:hypothetical protein